MYGFAGIATPNLDRLASQGVVFDRAITASTVCAPARASMMTGRYVSDHQVWTNDVPFRAGMECIAERMDALGYVTGAFGKLHHFPADDPKGFQEVAPMEEGRLGDREPYLQWLKARHPEVTGLWNARGLTFAYSEEEYYEHWIASQAIGFVGRHAHGERPFLAWVSFQGPHGPFDPPAEVKGTCDASAVPAPRRRPPEESPAVPRYRSVREGCPSDDDIVRLRVAYAEMIVAIDRQVGRILNAVEDAGLMEETTFLFSADHGDMLWDFGLTAKGPFPYGAQLGIPLVVANHPSLAAGTRSRSLAGNLDIPGTLLEIASAERGIGMSRSLLDLAQSEPRFPRTANFSEFCDSAKTVENDRYRFCFYPFSGEAELFDLVDDPDETVNLAGRPEFAGVRAEMMAHLLEFQILAKGVRVEAHDFVPAQQAGVAGKHPEYQQEFPVAFPLDRREVQRLAQAGLDTEFNAFCRGKDVLRRYTRPYWEE